MTETVEGNLHERLKKEGVATIKSPYLTASGVQDVTWMPHDWVDKVMARHAAAELPGEHSPGRSRSGSRRLPRPIWIVATF